MAMAKVNGLNIGYELIGDGERPWVVTAGGRFNKETPGLRQLAEALAAHNNRVLIWDRPNCGESDVCFAGESASIRPAWKDGMEAVADLPDWEETIERNPANRRRIVDQDRDEFIATMERWMLVYCPKA